MSCGDCLRRPRPLALQRSRRIRHSFIGQFLLRLQTLAALHALELCILQPAHLGLREPNLMLERRHLHRRRRHVHLLAHARNLRLMVLHVRLLPSPQRLFLGDQIDDHGPLSLRRLGLRLQLCDMLRQRDHLIAQPFRFNIMRLQRNQLLKIRMHLRSLFPLRSIAEQLNSGGKLEV